MEGEEHAMASGEQAGPGAGALPTSEREWAQRLTSDQYEVLRKKGTEPAFSGEYAFTKADGAYRCGGCGAELFDSGAKFESGTGWPSFFEPVHPGAVEEQTDLSHGMRRTEVSCSRCGGHLGHVFEDGPEPTGLRYCLNSVSLDFEPAPDR
jgi:peptide-methionine (R)-S-oxide reductase